MKAEEDIKKETDDTKTDNTNNKTESKDDKECDYKNDKKCNCNDEVDKLKKELVEEKNKYMRLVAEFDNFRRRIKSQEKDIIESGERKIIKNLLVVLDSFNKALSTDKDTIKQKDIEPIFTQLNEILKKEGLEKINTKIGEDFNVEIHEAISKYPEKDKNKDNKIVDIAIDGYIFKSKIIRYAQVIIGKYEEESNTK